MHCLQSKNYEKPDKFKGSYLEDLYIQIAYDNGFVKTDSDGNEVGNYNIKILEGPYGREIFKEGIIIKDPSVVWYVPDFLIDTHRQNKKDEADALKQKKNRRWKTKKEGSEKGRTSKRKCKMDFRKQRQIFRSVYS